MAGARFGAALHLDNYRGLRGTQVEITGVCSQSKESAEACAKKYEIPFATTNFDELLNRPDVDVIDICVPPSLHHTFAIKAAEAGKHLIMEKPLTGYFGEPGDTEPIGEHVSRVKMLEGARRNARAIRDAVRKNKVILCYAENWVYAPPIAKLRRLIQSADGGRILDLRAQESHSGSNSMFSKHWKNAGGGSLIRMGVHSIGACLHLKDFEGRVKDGKPIKPVSVIADTAVLMKSEAAVRAGKKWISADPADVENWANLSIAFDDGSRGLITVTDAGLGGLNTTVDVRMTNATLRANMTQNDTVQAYAPEDSVFGDEYFTEKLETRAGWNSPSADEGWFRGFMQEIEDFVASLRDKREPLAGIDLAVDCVEVIYAAYLSSAEGRKISL
jgi:predicted dehydrogenase